MTRMMADILRQPAELRACAGRLRGSEGLRRAGALLAGASDVYVAGIGASWHAAMAAGWVFELAGRPVHVEDASELLHRTSFRPGSALLLLSRSGRSVEVVGLLDLAGRHGLQVVAVTNAPDSPLGSRADVVLALGVGFDHAISIVTYTAVALGAALAAAEATGKAAPDVDFTPPFAAWREALEAWSPPAGPAYFLARGPNLASAHEARLLWEEAAKSPATALTTGGFRHGPQEIVRPGLLVGLWIDGSRRRAEDLALAGDLRRLGAQVLAVGRDLPRDAGNLVFDPPLSAWPFLAGVMPAQLAAERASRARGESCDAFRLCSPVVESEGGLLPAGR